MYRSAAVMKRCEPGARRARAVALHRSSPFPAFLALIPLLLIALMLTGCAQPGQRVAKSPTATKKIVAAVGPSEKIGAGKAKQEEAEATASAPAVIWQSADTLMGLESDDIRATLGAPARIRDEDTARIYQYVGGDCVLDLFLYQAEGAYRVTYAEARSVKAEKKPVEACLKSLPSPIVAANTPTS